MKSEIKKLDACTRELNIEVEESLVKSKFDEIYSNIGKQAKVPGFRPGTAPRKILEQHHAQLANEELIKTLIPESYEKTMEGNGLISYAPPEIKDVSLTNNILKFKARVEVRPEIALNSYKGIRIKRKEPEAREEDVNKQVETLAKERKRENDITDNFARSLGYKTLEELKDVLSKQIYMRSQEESYQDALNQILEQLVKDNPLNVPGVLVERQKERRLQEARYRLQAQGQNKEELENKIKELEPQLKEICAKEVKISLLLEEVAKKENLEVKDQSKITQRAIEYLFENAKWG